LFSVKYISISRNLTAHLLRLFAARSCGFPGEIANGYRKGYDFTFPNTVTYVCNDGFMLEGVASRTCQADGNWSQRLPWCQGTDHSLYTCIQYSI